MTATTSASTPIVEVHTTEATNVPRTSARRPPGRVATWTQVPRSSSSATAGHIVTSNPSMQTASGTNA